MNQLTALHYDKYHSNHLFKPATLATSTNVANFVPGTKLLSTVMKSVAIFGKNPYKTTIRLGQSIKNDRKPNLFHTIDLVKALLKNVKNS